MGCSSQPHGQKKTNGLKRGHDGTFVERVYFSGTGNSPEK